MKVDPHFLSTVTPFNLLPTEVINEVAELLIVIHYQKEEVIYHQEDTKMKGLSIIFEGEIESFFYNSKHEKLAVEHHQAPYCFGGMSILLNSKKSLKTAIVKKGTQVYFLHRKEFKNLCDAYEPFFQYFVNEFGRRMLNHEFANSYRKPSTFEDSYIATDQLYSRRIEGIGYKEIVSCLADLPIFQAAQIMSMQRVSCLFITNQEKKITGFVTDITLRDEVIAKRLDPSYPIASVADHKIVRIKKEAYIYEAILLMFSTKSRYLLVQDNDTDVGFISRNRLLSEQAQSPMVFIQSVKLALNTDELKEKWLKVPVIVSQLLSRGVNAQIVNQVITTIADTILQKVIEEVIKEIGSAPAKFVFIVLGSEGRKEQTLKTDQDNAIIYEDKANEQRELVRSYFLEFATRVSDKLNDIGFVYCSGDYMAKNPKWTHSLSHWKRNYKQWIEDALPESTIKFATMFDCRAVYGDTAIMDDLRTFVNGELQKPMEKFFVFMAKNALQYEPPLTFFKNIKTQKIDEQEVFDIKQAMTPIVDLVRVHALQQRIFQKENTGERLKALKEQGIFNDDQFNELIQSYYYLMAMRLKNQTKEILINQKHPTNFIELSSLTKIEIVTLKAIFRTIENFQAGIRLKFTGSLS